MSEVWSNDAADDQPQPPNGVVTVPAVDVIPNPMVVGGPGAVSASGAAGASLLSAAQPVDVSIAIAADDHKQPAAAPPVAAPGGPGGDVSIAIGMGDGNGNGNGGGGGGGSGSGLGAGMRPPPLVRLTSAQARLQLSLSAMGFGGDIIERAIVESNARTVEQAVEAIFAIMSHGDAPVQPVADADVISAQRANHAQVMGVLRDPQLAPGGPADGKANANANGNGDGSGSANANASDRVNGAVIPQLQKQLSIKAELLRQNLWECVNCTFHNALRRANCEMCDAKRPADVDANANANANGGNANARAGAGAGAGAGAAAPRAVEAPRPRVVDGVTCNICFEEVERKDMVDGTPCGHAFCRGCWRDYLNASVRDGKTVKVRCPDPRCKREVTADEFRARVSADLLPKFERFHAAAQLALNPNVRWCPTPGCESALHGTKAQPRLKCGKCQREVCFLCAEPWHGSRSCEAAADAQMAVYSRSANVKLCPRCRVRIERAEGCNHMTCGKCHYEFCWLCLGRYSSNHFAPWNLMGCPGLQSNSVTFVGDDRCCGVDCGCGCGVCGFIKRFFFRLFVVLLAVIGLALALGVGLPFAIICCPCLTLYWCVDHNDACRRCLSCDE